MARFVIQNKVYDTAKMELVSEVKKFYKFTDYWSRQLFGQNVGRNFDCKLYRSDKGNWLLTHKYNSDVLGEAITEKEAKKLLMEYDYDNYRKIFEDLEEA